MCRSAGFKDECGIARDQLISSGGGVQLGCADRQAMELHNFSISMIISLCGKCYAACSMGS